jgi:hypothetical protein
MSNENNKKRRKSASSTRSSTKLKIPPAFVPDKWICNHSLSRKRKYHQDLQLDKLKYIWPVYKSTSNNPNENVHVLENSSLVSPIHNAQSKLKTDFSSRTRNIPNKNKTTTNDIKAVKAENLTEEEIAEGENVKPIFYVKNYSSTPLIEKQIEEKDLIEEKKTDEKRFTNKISRTNKLIKDLKSGNLMRHRFRKRLNSVKKAEKMNLIREHSPTLSLSDKEKLDSSKFHFIRKILAKAKSISNKTRHNKLLKRRVSQKINKPLHEKLLQKIEGKNNKIQPDKILVELKSSEKVDSILHEAAPNEQLKRGYFKDNSYLNDSTLIGSDFFNPSKLTHTTTSLDVTMQNEANNQHENKFLPNRSVCCASDESTSSISACSAKISKNNLKSRSEMVQNTKCFLSSLLKSLSLPFLRMNQKETEDEKHLKSFQVNDDEQIDRTNQEIKEEEMNNKNSMIQSFYSSKLTPTLTSTPTKLNPFVKNNSKNSTKIAIRSEKNISQTDRLNAQVRSKSDSDFVRNQKTEKHSQVFSVHDHYLNGNEFTQHWVESGKSKLGIQIERFV